MAKKSGSKNNEVHITPAGIVNWVDPEWTKMNPQPGDPDGSFSIGSTGGGKVHTGQLRSLIDNEKKGK